MGKIRFCRYCFCDITSEWPRLKTICDKKECRDKQKEDHNADVKKRWKKNYEKKKAEKVGNRKCLHCGKSIPINQDVRRPVCFDRTCNDWWRAELYKRKLKRQKAWYAKNNPKVEKKKSVIGTKRPRNGFIQRQDDFTQDKFIEQLKKNKAKNGRICMADGCKMECNGSFYFCAEHRARNYRVAEIARVDGYFGGGEDDSRRAFGGVG